MDDMANDKVMRNDRRQCGRRNMTGEEEMTRAKREATRAKKAKREPPPCGGGSLSQSRVSI